jgi:hypothetical protein
MIYEQDRCKNERESGFLYRRLPLPEGADQSKSRQHFIMGTPNHSAGSEPANQVKASQIEADGKSSGEVNTSVFTYFPADSLETLPAR